MSMAQPWTERGLCKDQPLYIWHPTTGAGAGDIYARARVFCDACPVADECLAYALSINEQHGMWGGWSPEERRLGRRIHPPKKSGNPKGKNGSTGQRRKLNDAQVREIICSIDMDGERHEAVAMRYGVSTSTIWNAYRGVGAYSGHPRLAMSTEMKPSDPQAACSMVGSANKTGPGAAETAAEALEQTGRRSTP